MRWRRSKVLSRQSCVANLSFPANPAVPMPSAALSFNQLRGAGNGEPGGTAGGLSMAFLPVMDIVGDWNQMPLTSPQQYH